MSPTFARTPESRPDTSSAPDERAADTADTTAIGAPAGLPLFLSTLGRVPAGLSVGPPDHPDEREADRIASRMEVAPGSANVSAAMARSFGTDFSGVRLHNSPAAAAAADSIGARAFSVGQDIFFGRGAYAPQTQEGQHLLAHELTHTLQPGAAEVVRRQPVTPAVSTQSSQVDEPSDAALVCVTPNDATNLPPVQGDASAPPLPLSLDVTGPGPGGQPRIEHVQLDNPIVSQAAIELYVVPDCLLFATEEEARSGVCRVPCTPGDPNCAPLPATAPTLQSGTPSSSGASSSGTPSTAGSPAPSTSGMPTLPIAARPARFAPGQVVYALDGQLTVVSATADYVITRQYTKYAVGAGSTTLVRTTAGLVIVDAGIQQQGGNYNVALADAIADALAQQVGNETVLRLVLTHMHADHTLLVPRIYARIPFAVLEMNALQALMPGAGGLNKSQELVQQMLAERQRYVEAQVRRDLTANFGPWDLYIDPAARQEALDTEVQRETARRVAAMPATQVQLAVPADGQVTPVRVPIGNIGLPSGVAPTADLITQPSVGPGAATVLNPTAGATTQQMLASGRGPSNAVVDANSSSYLLVMPNGAQMLVLSDVRATDAVALLNQFRQAMAQLGKPVDFVIIDATHHLQRGFTSGDAVTRASQLGEFTRMLYELSRAQHDGTFVGGAVVVSVLGTPGAPGRNYVDPALVWIIKSAGYAVMPATGGGEIIGSGQDVSVVQAELGAGRAATGVVGTPYPTLTPGEMLIRRADAALAQIDSQDLPALNQDLRAATTDTDRTWVRQQLADKSAERTRINDAKLAYIRAVQGEIGRGPNNRQRSAVAPAPGEAEPALAEAAALRALLTNYTAPVAGHLPRFAPAALVVIGQEQMAQLTPEARELLTARNRVAQLAQGLRWSSTPEQRAPLVSALQDYRSRLVAVAATAQSPNRETLQTELARVDRDLATLTGLSPQQLEELRQAAALADQASRNVAHPAEVASTAELMESATASRVIAQNNGYALAEGQLYQLTLSGQAVTFNPVQLGPASVPRSPSPPSPPPLALPGGQPLALPPKRPQGEPLPRPEEPIVVPGVPAGFAQMPNVVNISGRTIILSDTGEMIPPTPSEPIENARPGELVVHGYSSGWFVCDPATGRPIAAALQGGEIWQVEAKGTFTLVVDMAGNVQAPGPGAAVVRGPGEEVPYGGSVPTPEAPAGGGPGTGTRVVAGGMGVLLVVQSILEPIGKALEQQRMNIAEYTAQLVFWARFGAKPTREMRTQNTDEIQPYTTPADTDLTSSAGPVYPMVTDIDVPSLATTLNATIQTYQDFVLWLDMGGFIEAIGMDPVFKAPTANRAPRTYWANVAGTPGTRRWRRIDLTSVLAPIGQRTLASLESTMQGRVSSLPVGERTNIFALKHGSETSVFRTQAGGSIHPREQIESANYVLGPSPWVHVLQRRDGWAYVEAANADAARSAMVSMYTIQNPIEKVLEEAQDGGRPIKQQWIDAGGRLQGFVAGPSPTDPRFGGDTRYVRHRDPDLDTANIWTIAIGQLDRFWVREDDLQGLDQAAVDKYAPAAPH